MMSIWVFIRGCFVKMTVVTIAAALINLTPLANEPMAARTSTSMDV